MEICVVAELVSNQALGDTNLIPTLISRAAIPLQLQIVLFQT
jgi:hypothetical protein